LFTRICVPPVQRFGRRLTFIAFSTLSGLIVAQSALASNITVASPVSGTRVASTVWVRAHNVGCNGLRPHAFGYSIDNSRAITWGVTAYDIDAAKVPVSPGTHTIHFKSWTSNGVCPVANTTFSVTSGNTPPPPVVTPPLPPVVTPPLPPVVTPPPPPVVTPPVSGLIPSNAVASDILDGKNWAYERDAAIAGDARGSTVYPATTPSYDDAREFYMTYSSRGGVRWHLSFAKDTSATHFVYDTYVYITDPSQVANIELDMNQVMSDGRTVILGTQCSVYSKTWEYTLIASGTHWHRSNIPCNPQGWEANTWHHVQIASHRDDSGNVTYDWVNLDGAHSEFQNATGNSAEFAGWQNGTLLINFQLDGAKKDSGTITAYIHELTVLRW
jgi:hypothetical protein